MVTDPIKSHSAFGGADEENDLLNEVRQSTGECGAARGD